MLSLEVFKVLHVSQVVDENHTEGDQQDSAYLEETNLLLIVIEFMNSSLSLITLNHYMRNYLGFLSDFDT